MLVNQKQLSQCIGLSDRQVRNLKSQGMFQRADGEKGYNLEKCVKEYIDFKISSEVGKRTSISKEEVQADHEEVKMQISMLRLRKLRRELHEAQDVESFLSDMLVHFRNRLLSLPPKLAMELSGERDMNQMIVIIHKEMLHALEELSGYDPDEIDGISPDLEGYDDELEPDDEGGDG